MPQRGANSQKEGQEIFAARTAKKAKMDIEAHDQFILSLEDSHPAKKFFIAFCECRDNSVGRHHDWAGAVPIEQAWVSADGKEWLYSNFAYQHLSFTLELDGCVNNIPHLTPNEVSIVETTPIMRALMHECCNVARSDKNLEILILANEVLAMLALGEEYIKFRKCAIRLLLMQLHAPTMNSLFLVVLIQELFDWVLFSTHAKAGPMFRRI